MRFFENGYAGERSETLYERALWLPEFRNLPRDPQLDNATLKEAESLYYAKCPFADRDEFAIAQTVGIEANFKRWLVHDAPPVNEGLYAVLISDASKTYEEANKPLKAFGAKLHREWTINSRFSYPQFTDGLTAASITAGMLIRAAAVGEPREFYSGVQLIDDRVAELSAAAPELLFSAFHELERVKRSRLYKIAYDYAVTKYGTGIILAIQLLLNDMLDARPVSESLDPEVEFEEFKKALPTLL